MIKDLTVGNPGSVLWRFSAPMFVGVIFSRFIILQTALLPEGLQGKMRWRQWEPVIPLL